MEYMEQKAQEQIEASLNERNEMLKRIEELSLAIINFSAGDIDEREVKQILCASPGNLEWCDNCEFCMEAKVIMDACNPSSLITKNYCDLGFWVDEI